MTLTELRYIVTLANERHFGRAAEKCHVSQPTLSVALKKVEQRYGITLFERGSSEVRLTPIGEQVAQQAERVLEESIRLREIAEQGKNPLIVDSKDPTENYQDFIRGEVRYASLAKLFPAKAEEAYKINEEDAKRRLETYKKLAAE